MAGDVVLPKAICSDVCKSRRVKRIYADADVAAINGKRDGLKKRIKHVPFRHYIGINA